MKEKIFNCHKISEGCIEGEVIISKDDIMFYLIKPETVLVASAIIMEIPMVDKVDEEFYKLIKNGDRIKLDATNGKIEIL